MQALTLRPAHDSECASRPNGEEDVPRGLSLSVLAGTWLTLESLFDLNVVHVQIDGSRRRHTTRWDHTERAASVVPRDRVECGGDVVDQDHQVEGIGR
jgi:hypothetical protein